MISQTNCFENVGDRGTTVEWRDESFFAAKDQNLVAGIFYLENTSNVILNSHLNTLSFNFCHVFTFMSEHSV